MDLFQICGRRVLRAQEHSKVAAELWNSSTPNQLYKSVVIFDPRTGKGSVQVRLNDPVLLMSISLEIGEMLYQLRAALEGVIYASAVSVAQVNPPPNARELSFPICEEPSTFRKALSNLQFLPIECIAFLESVQPFQAVKTSSSLVGNSVNQALSLLNELSRIDRHRFLSLARIVVVVCKPLFRLPPGMSAQYRFVPPMTSVEDGETIADFLIINFVPNPTIEISPNTTFGMGLSGEPIHQNASDHFGVRAEAMILHVADIVEWFANHFNSQPYY